MPSPIFHSIPQSPPGRMVEYVAKELGVELDYKQFDVRGGEMTSAAYTAKNPVRTIPTLDDNGVCIFDSHAIALYLVEKYGKNDSLYPKDHVQRAKVNSILFFETQFLFSRTRAVLEPLLYETKGFTYNYLIEKLGDSLERFERLLAASGTNFVAGNSVTVADFSCITSLSLLDIFYPVDAAKHPTVAAWRKRIFAKYPHIEEKEKQATDDVNKHKDALWTDKSAH